MHIEVSSVPKEEVVGVVRLMNDGTKCLFLRGENGKAYRLQDGLASELGFSFESWSIYTSDVEVVLYKGDSVTITF